MLNYDEIGLFFFLGCYGEMADAVFQYQVLEGGLWCYNFSYWVYYMDEEIANSIWQWVFIDYE